MRGMIGKHISWLEVSLFNNVRRRCRGSRFTMSGMMAIAIMMPV